jgi:hypothetical protein
MEMENKQPITINIQSLVGQVTYIVLGDHQEEALHRLEEVHRKGVCEMLNEQLTRIINQCDGIAH